MKVELSMLSVTCPFDDYFGSILDLKGKWTQEILNHFDDEYENRSGLFIWEGYCEIKKEVDYTEYEFNGIWRNLTQEEMQNLVNGIMPLNSQPFPKLDNCIQIPEK